MSGKAAMGKLTLRFIVTGVAATAAYFGMTFLLITRPLQVEPVLASVLGSGISILVSYVGHHGYTFRRKGRHAFYFPRFATITLFLFGMTTLGMHMFTNVIPYDPRYVTIAIAITYPIASYLLNLFWVFKTP